MLRTIRYNYTHCDEAQGWSTTAELDSPELRAKPILVDHQGTLAADDHAYSTLCPVYWSVAVQYLQ